MTNPSSNPNILAETAAREKEAIESTREILQNIEKEIATIASTKLDPPSSVAVAVADQMVHRASAAMADVHAHAMARVSGMREQLNSLEQTIIEARTRAEAHMTRFMQLVTEGEESIRVMEKAIARIGDHLTEES